MFSFIFSLPKRNGYTWNSRPGVLAKRYLGRTDYKGRTRKRPRERGRGERPDYKGRTRKRPRKYGRGERPDLRRTDKLLAL